MDKSTVALGSGARGSIGCDQLVIDSGRWLYKIDASCWLGHESKGRLNVFVGTRQLDEVNNNARERQEIN